MKSWISLAKSLCSIKASFRGSVWNSFLVADVTTTVLAWLEFKILDVYDQ